MRTAIECEIPYPDAAVIYAAVLPECVTAPSERSSITLVKIDPGLKLVIDAEDLVSARASINTWLRLLRIAEEMIDLLECEI
jgi:KEOPS complex subunit Pcc1